MTLKIRALIEVSKFNAISSFAKNLVGTLYAVGIVAVLGIVVTGLGGVFIPSLGSMWLMAVMGAVALCSFLLSVIVCGFMLSLTYFVRDPQSDV